MHVRDWVGPKLIFSDIDGTFLADDKSIPTPNVRLLDCLDEAGAVFVPCTGRMLSGIPREVVMHNCVKYAVCSDGACIVEFDGIRPKTLFKDGLQDEVVLNFYRRICDLDIQFDVFADGKSYCEQKRLDRLHLFPLDSGMRAFVVSQRIGVDCGMSQLVAQIGKVERLNVYYRNAEDGVKVKRTAMECGLTAKSHSGIGIEVTNPTLSKGTGLVWLSHYLGVNTAKCVAFGDGENDVAMLDSAGLGVAVSNAVASCKESADTVIEFDNNTGAVGLYVLGCWC